MDRVKSTNTPTNANIEIVPASVWDLNQVRALEQVCFPLDAWPLIEMIGVLTFPGVQRWKAMAGEHLVGFVAADVRPHQDVAWIATISVHPDYRRRGLGDRLMDKVEGLVSAHVARMRLSARASNRAAIALYQKRGYEQIDFWPKFYRGGEDAVVMEKRL